MKDNWGKEDCAVPEETWRPLESFRQSKMQWLGQLLVYYTTASRNVLVKGANCHFVTQDQGGFCPFLKIRRNDFAACLTINKVLSSEIIEQDLHFCHFFPETAFAWEIASMRLSFQLSEIFRNQPSGLHVLLILPAGECVYVIWYQSWLRIWDLYFYVSVLDQLQYYVKVSNKGEYL